MDKQTAQAAYWICHECDKGPCTEMLRSKPQHDDYCIDNGHGGASWFLFTMALTGAKECTCQVETVLGHPVLVFDRKCERHRRFFPKEGGST